MFDPNDMGLQKIFLIRQVLQEAMLTLKTYCPNSRELSLAVTKLEECEMWAVKSVGTDPGNCK